MIWLYAMLQAILQKMKGVHKVSLSVKYIISELKYRKLGGGRKKPKPYLYFVEGYA